MNLLYGGGKEDQTFDINPYLLIKPPTRTQCTKIHYLNLMLFCPQTISAFSI